MAWPGEVAGRRCAAARAGASPVPASVVGVLRKSPDTASLGSMLTCPICMDRLQLDGRIWRCPAGHAFDRAREGHVDLLPVGHGRSGITGDTREMARARQRVQEAGHYQALTERITARVGDHPGARGGGPGPGGSPATPVLVESGCGTGHYIGALVRAFPDAMAVGLDVSREALRIAARAHPRVTFAVNDVTRRLTLPDGSVDVLLDVFAPRNPGEFARVLRPDGLLLVAVPGPAHLVEMRAKYPMLDVERDKKERTVERLGSRFFPVWEEEVRWEMSLGPGEVADVVGMGPSAFHGVSARYGKERVTGDVVLLGLRHTAAGGS